MVESSLVLSLSSVLAQLAQLVQSEIPVEELPISLFRHCVKKPDWLDNFVWWDESNKREAIGIAHTIIELNELGLLPQIEFKLQRLAGVFFRDSMAHFGISLTGMEKWCEIAGLRNWEKEFLWISPQDYPLAIPTEVIRRLQIILELSRQGVPVQGPQIVVRKMYRPSSANLLAEMGDWFLIYTWPETGIISSFRKLVTAN